MTSSIVLAPQWWQFFIPPIWFSAPFELLLNGQHTFYLRLFSLMALIIPLVLIVLYTKLMPRFERNLQKLANHGAQTGRKGRWIEALSKLVCASSEEQAFFRFAWGMMGNERDFKLKIYPSLGFSMIFPFIFIFNTVQSRGFSYLAASKWYISIYFAAMVIPTVLMMLRYSGTYKGAWIYKTAPIQDTAPIFAGTVKAFITKLFLPLFTAESVLFVLLFGVRIVPDMIDVLLVSLLYTIIIFKLMKKSLPFSEPYGQIQRSESTKTMLLLLMIGAFVGLHFAVTLFSYGVYIYMAVLLLANWFVWRRAFRITWEQVAG